MEIQAFLYLIETCKSWRRQSRTAILILVGKGSYNNQGILDSIHKFRSFKHIYNFFSC